MQRKQIKQIANRLKIFRRKMVIHDSWMLIQNYLWFATLLIIAISMLGRLIPLRNLNYIISLPLLLLIVYTLVYILMLPKSNLSVGWRIDENQNLKERTSTAIALSVSEAEKPHEAQMLLDKQKNDALEILNEVDPRLTFKIQISYKKLLPAVFMLAVSALLILMPNPMDAILHARDAAAQAAQNEADKIEELVEEINNESQLSEEEKEELVRQLESLANQLRENDGNLAEALNAISNTEQSLLEDLDLNADFKRSTLDSMTSQLSDLAKQAAGDESDFSDIEDALAAIAQEMDSMSSEQKQSLSNELQMMAAQAAQAGAVSLSEAVSTLGQAVQTGSPEDLLEAAQNAAQAAGELENKLNAQQNLESALAQLQESRTAIAQSNQSGNATAAQNNGQQGDGQGNGQGQSQGQGQGQGQGSTAGGGGGSNADTLPPATGSGQAQDPEGQGQGGGVSNLEDQVFVPWERLQGNEDSLSISGQDTGQGQSQVSEQDQPFAGANSSSFVSYQEVFQNYQSSAFETIERSYIPPSLKDYILAYFTQLEP